MGPRSVCYLPILMVLGTAGGCAKKHPSSTFAEPLIVPPAPGAVNCVLPEGHLPMHNRPAEPLIVPPAPGAVNCVLPEGRLPMHNRPGDTTAVCHFTKALRYAKARRGDWDYSWFAVAYDVLKIERGEWTHEDVEFICCDTWPAPGSGIRVKKGAFPFRRGTVYAFSLDTSASPALIVGAEERSRLSPHGPAVRPSLDSRTHAKVTDAAMKFLRSDANPAFSWSRIAEETAHCYVVEFGHWGIAGAQTWNVVVRKDTLQAESLPPAQPARGSLR